MGKYRTLITGLVGSALLTLACTSQALTLTAKQQQHLAEARKEMGLGPDDMLKRHICCLLYTSPSPRDATLSRMPSSA